MSMDLERFCRMVSFKMPLDVELYVGEVLTVAGVPLTLGHGEGGRPALHCQTGRLFPPLRMMPSHFIIFCKWRG